MIEDREWLKKNRTLVTAWICTAVLFGACFTHLLQPGRCVLAFVFVWALASHSKDISDHKAEVLALMEETARAGVEFRAGRTAPCAEDLTAAGKTAVGLAREIRAERESEAAG